MKRFFKKAVKAASIVTIISMVSCMLSACSVTEDPGLAKTVEAGNVNSGGICHTIYVVGQTRIDPAYNYESLLLDTIMSNYEEEGSTADVIRVDGDSKLACSTLTYEGTDKMVTDARKRKIRKKAAKEVISAIELNTTPVTPEEDVLSAITIAANQLGTYDSGIKKLVMVLAGAQTTAPLDMSPGLDAYADESVVKNTVDELKAISAIPDLSGVYVDCYGIGNVTSSDTQPRFTPQYKSNLEAIYKAIFYAANVKDVIFHSDEPDGEAVDISSKPAMKPVAVYDNGDLFQTSEHNVDMSKQAAVYHLNFKPGVADLISSKEEIDTALTQTIQYASEHPESNIAVFASTASAGTDDELYALGLARADKIKQELIARNVPESRIITYSLGYKNNPKAISDRDANGNLIEPNASQNRAVFITDAGSSAADIFYQKLSV